MSQSELRAAYLQASGNFSRGELKEAWQASRSLNERAPGFSLGWELTSRVAQALGDHSVAIQFIDRALALEPEKFTHRVQKTYCLLAQHEHTEAGPMISGLIASKPDTAAECDALGNLCSANRDISEALVWFEQAVILAPKEGHHWVNLALTRQANGDLNGAEEAFDIALRYNSDDHEAWLHRSRLRKQIPEHNHVSELQEKLASLSDSWRPKMTLHYALAKELEDLAEYPLSFEHLKKGAELRRSHMRHDAASDLQAMSTIASTFSRDYLNEAVPSSASSEPIFIVGLPRTGTTLVERILGTHSDVYAAGELNSFAESLTKQVRLNSADRPTSREAFIAAASQVDFKALGSMYIQSTRPYTGHCEKFVDKLPLNFLYCGLIARALPNAKIIHLTRHPMDTCFAIYKTIFKQAYPFSYDLDELVDYYLGYRQLMAHWQKSIPGRILDVSYDTLVKNFEPQCRRIIAHCDLQWQQSCLMFHENEAPSTTASLAQVRQPIYSSSIGRWRNYSRQLQPLYDRLESAGIALD